MKRHQFQLRIQAHGHLANPKRQNYCCLKSWRHMTSYKATFVQSGGGARVWDKPNIRKIKHKYTQRKIRHHPVEPWKAQPSLPFLISGAPRMPQWAVWPTPPCLVLVWRPVGPRPPVWGGSPACQCSPSSPPPGTDCASHPNLRNIPSRNIT